MFRRSFIAGAAASLVLPSLARAQGWLADDPFGLGIASGRPAADSVVLWTRLMARERSERLVGTITVGWSVAEDETMQRIVRSGEALAEPRWAHSVHVDVGGLKPNRPYWYRFIVGRAESPVGRARTAPSANERLQELRFAFASCQQYEQGFYSAYSHMAADELDLVVHLGDYIYEKSWGRDLVRHHESKARITTLDQYRDRYALYKSDRDLQAAHASHPWIVTWDDHEVDDDYTDDISPQEADRTRFLAQRAGAYQAFWEHMPLSNAMRPQGPSLTLHDRYRYGQLAEFHVLDDRQYRSHHACSATLKQGKSLEGCAERVEPGRTMLGTAQETWFNDGMARASTRWNIVAQQTLMAELDRGPGERHVYWADGWDGYPAPRQRLLDAVAASPVKDTLVLGGDVHSFWAADLKQDFAAPGSRTVATEFVGGSITSQGPANDRMQAVKAKNPHIRSVASGVNGYAHVALDQKKALVSFRTVRSVKEPDSSVQTLARFAVEVGRPGVQQA